MYRSRFWTMRQYAGYATAEESNKRYHYLLEQGTTGLSVAFDLPTQMGYDADHPLAEGEVGKVGVSISSLEDMEALFGGIPLAQVSTSMTINAPPPFCSRSISPPPGARASTRSPQRHGAERHPQGIRRRAARISIRRSPRCASSPICFTIAPKMCRSWNTISISGYHIREAGSTAAQEIGFTLSNGIAYVQAAVDAGLNVDEFARQLSFFFNAHNNLLEEVAKFRAARRMWARIMRERFGAQDPRSWLLRFHTQTAGSTLTAQQPDNNIVRTAYQALAAVLGGTQSLHTNSKDEALSLPTERPCRSRCARSKSSPMKPASPTPLTRWPGRTMSKR